MRVLQVELLDAGSSKKACLAKNRGNYFCSKTFKSKCLTQGSEPASRDISPNNNNNNVGGGIGVGGMGMGPQHLHLQQKPMGGGGGGGGMKQQRPWYKSHRRMPKMVQQPQSQTPQHKRKKQLKQPLHKLDVD